MPFSAGVFSLVAGNPVVTGTTISSTWANNTLNDIADNGLTLCLLKDGTQTPTANIPLGGFRITGLGAATTTTDAARADQVQNSTFHLLSSVAGTDTITATAPLSLAAYEAGQKFLMTPANANTGAATLNINNIGARNIKWTNGPLAANILKQNVPIEVSYDGSAFNVIGNSSFLHSGFLTSKGVLIAGSAAATAASVAAGTDGQVLEATASATPGMAWKWPTMVQQVYAEVATVVTGAATIPVDNTIPLATEGTATGVSLTITPKSVSNYLLCIAQGAIANDGTGNTNVLALFQDGTASASAIACSGTTTAAVNSVYPVVIEHRQQVGQLAATTFTLRVGANAGNWTLNGSAGARLFGGAMKTSLTVIEVAP